LDGPECERAWDRLAPEVTRRLGRWCRAAGHGPLTDREDVAADVHLELVRRLPRAWPASRARGVDPSAFLWRLVRLVYIDTLRTRLGRAAGYHADPGFWALSLDVAVTEAGDETFAAIIPDRRDGPAEQAEAGDYLRRVWAGLAPADRLVLAGRLTGIVLPEMGAALGISMSGAGQRWRRMLPWLRAIYSDDPGIQPGPSQRRSVARTG
jgi:DNA-directed RNA polymerase specialized sigma24 family protein